MEGRKQDLHDLATNRMIPDAAVMKNVTVGELRAALPGERSEEVRAALARAIQGGYADDSIDPDLYQNDPVYHAVVWEVRRARLAVTEQDWTAHRAILERAALHALDDPEPIPNETESGFARRVELVAEAREYERGYADGLAAIDTDRLARALNIEDLAVSGGSEEGYDFLGDAEAAARIAGAYERLGFEKP